MSIKISCIIPLYNAENYISRSLDSVLKQTLLEFEVIVIDDGSKDTSPSIVEKYSQLDHRIHLLSQENQGVSITRNNGIKIAKGEYIFFLDADDTIVEDAFLSSYNKAVADSSDILVFNYKKIYGNRESIKHKKLKEELVYSNLKHKKKILSTGVTPWCKLYSREFLINNNIFFYPNIYYEDIPFFWQSVLLSKRISFLNKNIYKYYQNADSIMNSDYTYRKIEDIMKSMLLVRETLLECNEYENYKDIYEIKIIKTFLDFFNHVSSRRKKIFDIMTKKLNFIDITTLRGKMSLFKYLKYKIFLSGKYITYRLFFNWF